MTQVADCAGAPPAGSGLAAGASYFALVFAAGFLLGVPRTLWLEPALGPLAAVLVELPLMLGVAWLACSVVLRRQRLPPRPGPRLVMGGVALLLLLAAEVGLALVLGRSLAELMAHQTTAAGGAGLLGQVAFALLPLVRGASAGG